MKALFVGAHFDDIELIMGGTVAKFSSHDNRHQAYCIVTSDSSYTNYKGEEVRSLDRALTEGIQGLQTLGVSEDRIYLLNFPTKSVPYDEVIIEQLDEIIHDIRPDLIFTHYMNDSHQDHFNTARAVISAARYQNTILMGEALYPSNVAHRGAFRPVVYTDITSTFNYKLKAIQCHQGEIQNHSFWIDQVTALGRTRGIEVGSQYAEAFEPVKMELKI